MKKLSDYISESIAPTVDESILASSGAGKAKIDAEYIKCGLEPKRVRVNNDGTIDYDGSLFFKRESCKNGMIPFKFNVVYGSFNCSGHGLTTLKGSPKTVYGSFNCADNRLTTLDDAPEYIAYSFNCSSNYLKDLVGGPKKVGGQSHGCDYSCWDNKLVSLKGAPKKIHGSFICSSNQLTSLLHGPEEVSEDYNCTNNRLKTLEGAPKNINGDFYCNNNLLTNLTGAPKTVSGCFAIEGNTHAFTNEEVKKHIDVKHAVLV